MDAARRASASCDCSAGKDSGARASLFVMPMRRQLLVPLVGLLGAAVVVLPAAAGSETTPAIQAENVGEGVYGTTHRWSPATINVSPGGVVSFSNPYATTPHGLKFTGATPSCTGIPAAAGQATGATNWHGECTFSTPGTYSFICTVHPAEMKGTVTVTANGTTTTTITPSPTPGGTLTTASPTTNESGPGAATGSPLAGSASQAVKLAFSQKGKSVHGSVEVSQAGAGGRLEVDLLAKGASLASGAHLAQLRAGRLVRSSLRAGTVSFTVPLSAKAKRALARHGRLALGVKIVLKPATGSAVTITRSVVLHA
jgi:plastocyanin